MDTERYNELQYGDGVLTKEEMAEGWHFCPEWDGMLLTKEWPEAKCCPICNKNGILGNCGDE